jgi:beta-lactamase class A
VSATVRDDQRIMDHLHALDAELAGMPGVSVWCAPLGSTRAAYARNERQTHYAASMMKIAVLGALFRASQSGALDIDVDVPIENEFDSAKPGAPPYCQLREDDQDEQVWDRLGERASLRWLARRMITVSGNLAANIVLSHVGTEAIADVMAVSGACDGQIRRGIADLAARDAGIDNQVSARDLAMLLAHIATAPGSGDMLDMLLAQERREDLAAGLPADTRLAHKNGFIGGIRHGAGIVFPVDAPPYTIVVCTTSRNDEGFDDRRACSLIARIAAASWADRVDFDPSHHDSSPRSPQ